MRSLAIVPAKKTSRRLPGKNRLELGGQELWLIAVSQAIDAGCDYVVVATDDHTIEPGKFVGSPAPILFVRIPESLGLDDNRVEWTVRYVLDQVRSEGPFDVVVVLNPTHPLRHPQDIKACVDACGVWPSCTGVRRDYSYSVPEGARLETMNAQDRVPRLVVTGAIYAVRVPAFMEFGKLMIYGNVTRGTWHEEKGPYVDIDTLDDFVCAKALWEARHAEAGTHVR